MTRDNWTKPEVRTLRELWAADMSGGQIAEYMGRTRGSIMSKLARLGLYKTKVAEPPKPLKLRGKTERNAALIADYLSGMSLVEVGEKYGIKKSAVAGILYRNAVRLPPEERRLRRIKIGKWSRGRPPIWPDCPAHLRSDYDRFRRAYGYRSAEARALLEA